MTQLVILRHGESIWNQQKRFTGWTDVGLNERGVEEAKRAARLLAEQRLRFDVCFTSLLGRATETLRIVLEEMQIGDVPIRQSWRLNERHFGALQGMSRLQALLRFGPLPLHGCQRRFAVRPPALAPGDPRFPGLDPRYAKLASEELPLTESLEDTYVRLMPYFESEIAPALRSGQNVLVVAHKNSLRALVKHLENVSDERTPRLKIPTGEPVVYELDEDLATTSRTRLRAG